MAFLAHPPLPSARPVRSRAPQIPVRVTVRATVAAGRISVARHRRQFDFAINNTIPVPASASSVSISASKYLNLSTHTSTAHRVDRKAVAEKLIARYEARQAVLSTPTPPAAPVDSHTPKDVTPIIPEVPLTPFKRPFWYSSGVGPSSAALVRTALSPTPTKPLITTEPTEEPVQSKDEPESEPEPEAEPEPEVEPEPASEPEPESVPEPSPPQPEASQPSAQAPVEERTERVARPSVIENAPPEATELIEALSGAVGSFMGSILDPSLEEPNASAEPPTVTEEPEPVISEPEPAISEPEPTVEETPDTVLSTDEEPVEELQVEEPPIVEDQSVEEPEPVPEEPVAESVAVEEEIPVEVAEPEVPAPEDPIAESVEEDESSPEIAASEESVSEEPVAESDDDDEDDLKPLGQAIIDVIVDGVPPPNEESSAVEQVDKTELIELVDSGMVKKLTVTKLKRLLSANNLKTSGRKAELVARLISFAKSQ